MAFEYKTMPPALQSALVAAIQSSAGRKSCWDIVETIVGLAKLKIPAAFFQQCSLSYYLASKSNLLGPSPTSKLILSMGMLHAEAVDFDADVMHLMQPLSKKWSARMPAKEFFATCLGLALLSQRRPVDTEIPSTLAAVFAPYVSIDFVAMQSQPGPEVNRTSKALAVKVSVEFHQSLAAMEIAEFVSFLQVLVSHGLQWSSVFKHQELRACIESTLVRVLSTQTDHGLYHLQLLVACVKLKMKWATLASPTQEAFAAMYAERVEAKADATSALDLIWGLGALGAPLGVTHALPSETAVMTGISSDADLLKLLLALGGMGWKWPLHGKGKGTREALESRIQAFLTTNNFDKVVYALERIGFSVENSSSATKAAIFRGISGMSGKAKLFSQTIGCLDNLGILKSVPPEAGTALISEISYVTDSFDEHQLLVILRSMPSLTCENPFEKVYLSKRLFQNALIKGKSEMERNPKFVVDLLQPLSAVFSEASYVLGETDEDLEMIDIMVESIEVKVADAVPLLQAMFQIGLKWDLLSVSAKTKIEDCIRSCWGGFSEDQKRLTRELVEALGAWDLNLPEDVVVKEDIDTLDWQSVEQLKQAINKVPSYMIPETLGKCVSLGIRLSELQGAAVWIQVDAAIAGSKGDVKLWKPCAVKVPMLLKCLGRLGVPETALSQAARASIDVLLISTLGQSPARSVSNLMYYAARMRWVLSSGVMSAARVAFFRTCKSMSGEGEFANALWATTYMAMAYINLADSEIEALASAFEELIFAMNPRDLATAIGALKTMRATWASLPPSITSLLLDRTADVVGDMDGTSLSLSIFSFGSMGLAWSDLSPVVRALAQDSLFRLLPSLQERELYWTVVGLGRMNASLEYFSSGLVAVLLSSAAKIIKSPTLKPDGFIALLDAFASMGGNWTTVSHTLEAPLFEVLKSKLPDLSQKYILELVVGLHKLGLSWPQVNKASQELILRRLEADAWVLKKKRACAAFETLVSAGFRIRDAPESLGMVFVDSAVDSLHRVDSETAINTLRLLVQGHATRKCLTDMVPIDNLIVSTIGAGNITTTLKLLRELKNLGITWDDVRPSTRTSLSTIALRLFTLNKDNRLLLLLTSMGATIASSTLQIDIHKKSISDSTLANIKLIESLKKRLPELSDEDFIRVVYLLGVFVDISVV
jgi:hypothetical protein